MVFKTVATAHASAFVIHHHESASLADGFNEQAFGRVRCRALTSQFVKILAELNNRTLFAELTHSATLPFPWQLVPTSDSANHD